MKPLGNLGRRRFLQASCGLLLPAVLPTVELAHIIHPRRPIVLVHGAWHGGWCWRDVVPSLLNAGHKVLAPTMTGLGERAHLIDRSIDLSTHVHDIMNAIEFEELNDIVLVGHSYAGLVVSMVADRMQRRISQLVFLDAVLPVEGQAMIEPARQAETLERYGDDYLLPVSGLDFLGIAENHPSAEWVRRRLTPHPLGTLLEPVIYLNGGPGDVPKTFIRCVDSPRLSLTRERDQRLEADPEWDYRTLDTGHDAMITAPADLANMLLEIALR